MEASTSNCDSRYSKWNISGFCSVDFGGQDEIDFIQNTFVDGKKKSRGSCSKFSGTKIGQVR